MTKFDIVPSPPDAQEEILALYPRMFPEEDLTVVVAELLDLEGERLSLVALSGSGEMIGHVIFTFCQVGAQAVALLGPLGVLPEYQKSGIGSALVKKGHEELVARGIGFVLVLGNPAYYGRFGFCAEIGVAAPYDLPEDWAPAWQSLVLAEDSVPEAGRLQVPGPWRNPAYWAP